MRSGPLESIAVRASRIDWLVLDVDGVLTDGGIVYSDDRRELKRFHVRDGTGLKLWREAGKRSAIITGRSSPIVEVRARELGIDPIYQGAADKGNRFEELLAVIGVEAERVCAIGDDLPDLPMFHRAGLAIAVADACAEAKEMADHVVETPGGHGAVRTAIEWILGHQGLWNGLVKRYRGIGD